MQSERQIQERIYNLKKEIEVLQSVLEGNNKGDNYTFGRPKGTYKYTQEQIDFLKDCVKNKLKDKKIVDLFNIKFKTNFPINSRGLYNFMTRSGIKSINYTPKRFNEEEDKFILENFTKMTQQELANKLDRSRDSVKNRLNLLQKNKFEEKI